MKNEFRLGSVSDFSEGNYAEKKFFFVLAKVNNSSSYEDKLKKTPVKAFPASFLHPLEVEVYDKTKQRKRIMRYIPGENSIWKDEQSPDKDVPKVKQVLEFMEGRRLIEGEDVLLLEFLFRDPYNGSNKDRDPKVPPVYRLIDMEQEVAAEMKKDLEMHEVINWCYKGDWDQVAAYARAMNISLNREPKEVRFRMRQLAQANPQRFFAGMNNPLVLRKHYILEAVETGTIIKEERMNALLWPAGGVLCQGPVGVDVVDFFVDHSVTPSGQGAYDIILTNLGKDRGDLTNKKADALPPVKESAAPTPEVKHSGIGVDEAEKVFHKAMEVGALITYGKSTFAYDVTKISENQRKEGKDAKKFTGMTAVMNALRENPTFLQKVKDRIVFFEKK